MLALPPVAPATGWRAWLRLPRDYYVRLDGNDYSVHPSVIGRRIEVVADLDRVRVFCDGKMVADHERLWAKHQSVSEPEHVGGGKRLRRDRIGLLRPAPNPRSRSAAWPTTTSHWASRLMAGWRDGRNPSRDEDDRAGPDRRGGVPDPGFEGADAARVGARLAERAARSPGPTRSSCSPACNARSPPASPTAARAASARPVPGPQELGGVRLRPRPRPQTRHHRPPRHLDFITAKENVVFLGPPGTGKTHLAIGLAIRACQAGHRVLFATASEWVDRLATPPRGRCRPSSSASAATRCSSSTKSATSLRTRGGQPVLPAGVLPLRARLADRHSNKQFGRWGEVFGDDVVAAAMIDRLVHHAESSPSKATATGSKTATSAASQQPPHRGLNTEMTDRGSFSPCRGSFSAALKVVQPANVGRQEFCDWHALRSQLACRAVAFVPDFAWFVEPVSVPIRVSDASRERR